MPAGDSSREGGRPVLQMVFLVGISKRHMAVAVCGQDTRSGSRGSVGPALVTVMPRAQKPVLPHPGPQAL